MEREHMDHERLEQHLNSLGGSASTEFKERLQETYDSWGSSAIEHYLVLFEDLCLLWGTVAAGAKYSQRLPSTTPIELNMQALVARHALLATESSMRLKWLEEFVKDYFENYFTDSPPPNGWAFAVFAAGSLARQECVPGSDPAILCVADFPQNEQALNYYSSHKELAYRGLVEAYQSTLKEIRSAGNAPPLADFDGPAAKGMIRRSSELLGQLSGSILADGCGNSEYSTAKTSLKSVRAESANRETWRYWLAFESVTVYEYPATQGTAEDTEDDSGNRRRFSNDIQDVLLDWHFGILDAANRKEFPIMRYYAACRLMSTMYVEELRLLTLNTKCADALSPQTIAKQEEKIKKLKDVRVMLWAYSMVNCFLLHLLGESSNTRYSLEGNDEDAIRNDYAQFSRTGWLFTLRAANKFFDKLAQVTGNSSRLVADRPEGLALLNDEWQEQVQSSLRQAGESYINHLWHRDQENRTKQQQPLGTVLEDGPLLMNALWNVVGGKKQEGETDIPDWWPEQRKAIEKAEAAYRNLVIGCEVATDMSRQFLF